jgi:hypothetical protein
VALGTTAPELSVILPRMLPRVSCAEARGATIPSAMVKSAMILPKDVVLMSRSPSSPLNVVTRQSDQTPSTRMFGSNAVIYLHQLCCCVKPPNKSLMLMKLHVIYGTRLDLGLDYAGLVEYDRSCSDGTVKP